MISDGSDASTPCSHLLEGPHDGVEQEVAQEELVAAGHRRGEVTESECGTVLVRVRELVQASDEEADHVQCERGREVLCEASAYCPLMFSKIGVPCGKDYTRP